MMEYRTLPHGGEQISVIGLGSGSLTGTEQEMADVIGAAIDNGINYFDIAPSVQAPLFAYARAFEGRREQIMTQMHFGAVYQSGKYGWTRELDKIKEQLDWQMKLLHTDYTDMGFIHCVDDLEDLDVVMRGGLWDYMKELKAQGTIRHLGFSSHNPGYRPAYPGHRAHRSLYVQHQPLLRLPKGRIRHGEVAQRARLYRDCERMGVGISVMKPFAGGQLLDAKTSLFKRSLTHVQCFQYALDRPAVLTVLPGVRNMEDLKTVLRYVDATAEEKDYSVIGEFTPRDATGVCVYCNHCQPCPMDLDVGLINKYYDLALVGDEMAKGHYWKLPVRADACVKCGHCESRCPFHVKQESRMEEIAAYFSCQ